MTYNHSLVRQQKVVVGIGALVGSFVIGAMLPLYAPLFKQIEFPEIPFFQGKPVAFVESPTMKVAVNKGMQGLSNTLTQIQTTKEKRLNSFVPSSFAGKTFSDVKLAGKQKVIALTFDDGPWPTSSPILDVLKKQKVKATFFVIGRHLQLYPNMARRMVADGHALGNHTWSHQYHNVSRETAVKEIQDTGALLYKITGAKTTLFRPPGGMMTNGLVDYAQSVKMGVAMWSTDSQESSLPSESQLIHNVVSTAKSGGIVLLHDGGGERSTTLKALPKIITQLRKQGYQFVTIPQLLELKEKELQAKVKAENSFTKPAEANKPVVNKSLHR